MAFIYLIENDINDKVYVGKTNYNLKKRFREHISDAPRFFNRPLYAAMRKYGVEHFSIKELEYCSREDAPQREQYWIQYYDSFKNGYNATLGGDGRCYANVEEILNLWNQGQCIAEIHNELGYDKLTISNILEDCGIDAVQRQKRGHEITGHSVAQIDMKTGEIVAIYPTVAEACKALGKQQSGHIAQVCNGKRLSIYGYKWKYVD